MKKRLLSVLTILLFTGTLVAQDLKFDAQLRYRGEFQKRMGSFNAADFRSTFAGDNFELLRSRFGITLMNGTGVSAYIQLQDSRLFGEELNTLTDASADMLDLHQGYIELSDIRDSNFDLKIGRMELNLGNERLVGAVGWSNTGRSFDGGIISRSFDKGNLQIFNFKIDENKPYADFDPDRSFSGLWYTYEHSDSRKFHLFSLLDIDNEKIAGGPDADKRALVRNTVGFYYTAKTSKFNYDVEAAYQTGNQFNSFIGKRLSIGAYMFGARLKYMPERQNNPFIGIGIDYISGDDDRADENHKVFNTLYATNHKFYGHMDYFIDVPAATSNLGLIDMIVTGGINVRNSVSLSADLHFFSASKEDVSGNSTFGTELDTRLNYRYSDDCTFLFGGSFMLPGDIPKTLQDNDKTGWWFYLMLTYNFKQ